MNYGKALFHNVFKRIEYIIIHICIKYAIGIKSNVLYHFFLYSRIQNVAGSRYLYSFNPCYPFSEGTCKDVAVRSN